MTALRSMRNRAASIRGARAAAPASPARSTNRRGRIGRNSATGVPLRLTTIVRPASISLCYQYVLGPR